MEFYYKDLEWNLIEFKFLKTADFCNFDEFDNVWIFVDQTARSIFLAPHIV